MKTDDTIIAVSSPPGRAARGLLRLSGPHTHDILRKILLINGDASFTERKFTVVRLIVDAAITQKNHTIPAILVTFDAPRSYTGQACAEIQLPGNPALMDRVLHRAIAAGARLAEPGEFTMRAFLSGKMDLTQAEGVAATIAAQSDGELHAAGLLRDGALTKLSHKIVDHLATQLALVESGIDFVDQDDVVPIGAGALDAALAICETQLQEVLLHSRSWSALSALPRVVLVGKPSSGKSTLFNALLGSQRAVISESPGTTRDCLIEPITLHNAHGVACEALLVDIAGLDSPLEMLQESLDHLVQQAAHRAIENADVILLIDDGRGEEKISSRAPVIHVRTKADLISQNHLTNNKATSHRAEIQVCAITGAGLENLRSTIAQRLADRLVSISESMLTLQPRHEAALRTALDSLRNARALLAQQSLEKQAIDHVELVAGSLRSSLDELAALGGEMTPDDIIGRVFATFCVGK